MFESSRPELRVLAIKRPAIEVAAGLVVGQFALTPAAMRPNEISESALRAAFNAISAATVKPGASPRAFRAAVWVARPAKRCRHSG